MRRLAPFVLLLAALALLGWLAHEPLLDAVAPGWRGEDGASLDEDAIVGEGADAAAAARDPAAAGPTLLGVAREAIDREAAARAAAAREAAGKDAAALAREALLVPLGGTLLDAEGRPVAGARIVLANDAESVTLITREDGAFEQRLLPGRYDVLIEAPGRGSLYLEDYLVDAAARLDLALELAPPRTLTFTLSRDGRGVEGARAALRLTRWRWDGKVALAGLVTDADGRAVFTDLTEGTYELRVAVPDGPELVQTHEVKQDLQVRAVVPDAVELSGVVTDAATQARVAQATVRVRTAVKGGPTFEVSVESTADGSFRALVPRGQARELSVTAPGYAPWPEPRYRNFALGKLKGLAGKEPVTLAVALSAGGALAGQVTQAQTRAPIPGVTLQFRHRRGGTRVSALTDAEGRYAVPHLNPGPYDVVVESAGWFPERALQVSVPPAAAEPVVFDVALLGARTVRGSVVMAQGAPVKGARVWLLGGGRLVRSARGAGRPLETFSGPDGSWSLSDVPPQLGVVVRGALGPLEAVPGFSDPKQGDAAVRLVLSGTVDLSGRVVDQVTGDALANVRVALAPKGPPWGREGRSATTGADGTFRFEDLLAGDVELTPRRNDYLRATPRLVTLSAEDEQERVELTLDPGAVVAGWVGDLNGRGLTASLVLDGTADGSTDVVRRSLVAGADGRFRLTGLRSGTYRLRVNAKGFKGQTLEGLRGGEERLRLQLTPVPAPGS